MIAGIYTRQLLCKLHDRMSKIKFNSLCFSQGISSGRISAGLWPPCLPDLKPHDFYW